MPTRAWFPTFLYHEPLHAAGLAKFNAELADECRNLRDYDTVGRQWSAKNYPGGYTSGLNLAAGDEQGPRAASLVPPQPCVPMGPGAPSPTRTRCVLG